MNLVEHHTKMVLIKNCVLYQTRNAAKFEEAR